MKKLKRFTLAVSLAMATWQQALPCWDVDDPSMYNHFHCVPELPSIEERNLEESARFWADYVGKPYNEDFKSAVEYLYGWILDDEETNNELVKALREQGKTDALEFLRINCDLYKLQDNNSWDYTKATPEDYEAILKRIDALKLTGELAHRKTFMKMRCLFSLKDYPACLRLWDSYASKWDPSPLRSRCEGYVAGVYCRRKDYDKAIPLYFELGDDRSIQYCVNRMLSSTSIEQEYLKDPNSLILGYIVEDYANYYYHAKRNDYWEPGVDNPIWTKVTTEARKNIALAERIVKEKKAKDLQMWQTFIGFLQLADKQPEAAYQSFVKAEGMKGNGIVTPSIRVFKYAAALQMKNKIEGFEDYMLSELAYLRDDSGMDKPEAQTFYSLYNMEIQPYIMKYVEANGDERLNYVAETVLGYPYEVKWKMDREMSLEQVLAIQEYMKQKPTNKLETYFKGATWLNDSKGCLDEFIGTKLMRMDRYEEAAQYFARVPIDYIKTQGIMPYLATRTMPEFGFERQQYAEPEYDPDLADKNFKLEFCQRVIDLKSKIGSSSGEQRAEAQLELAKWLFQASAGGDLWGYSEYSKSAYDSNRNELSDQAIACLQDAVHNTRDYNKLVECYFGLAAIDVNNENVCTYDSDSQGYYIEAVDSQRQGYQWLKKQVNRSHPIFTHCDWLKLYVK